ncbi:hypothetical protein JCM9279_005659 [Rhodotorula babjevae]
MTSAPPTPLRPLCRTRRRSSSLSSVLPSTSSSPDRGAAWSQYRSPTRGDAKRAKRTRGGDSASFQKPPSPLKQSQPALYPPPHDPDHVWTHPHPFGPSSGAAALDPASSSTTSSFGASINPQPLLFCASAGAFALPGIVEATHERTRNPSTESSSFPSHASLSSSKGSFDDSSFASDSPPDSLPSPSTSPDTSLGSSALLAAACAPPTSSSSAFAHPHPLPLVPPPLRRATSCTAPMQCDPTASPLSTPLLGLPLRADELGEAERLHHVAFEQLRSATRDEEEHFVERMRRWEAARGDPFAAEPELGSSDDDDDDLELELDEDGDEIEVTLDLGSSAHSLAHDAHAPVSRTELDELARRLQAGACELEDYALTLLPPAILLASSRFDPPSPSFPFSPVTVTACVAPLLLAGSTFGSSTSAVPLACGLVAVGARACAWLVLADGATSTPFQVMWSAAPIATVLTSLLAFANLAVRPSPSAALYPLPSMLLFVLTASLLHLVTLGTTLAGLLSSAPPTDRDSLPKSALATVPVALAVLVAARIGTVELPAFAPSCAAAALGTVLVGWAARARTPGPGEVADEPWLDSPRLRMSPRGHSPRSHSPPGVTRHALAARSRSIPFLAVVPFVPALALVAQALLGGPIALPTLPLHRIDPYYANRLGLFDHTSSPSSSSSSSSAFSPPTLDIVFAYYDSPVAEFAAHVAETLGRGTVRKFRTRVSVYDKGAGAGGNEGGEERRRALEGIEGVDEVVQLENVGREGGTYLHHILRRFDAPTAADLAFLGPAAHDRPTSHADMTLFLQHHLAWAWVGAPRFDHVDARTGFLSLGPYVKSDCGVDQRVWGDFRRMRELYSMLCPPTLQLASWAAQFFVSRARIVANPRAKYARVQALLEAPEGHWLGEEGASFGWGGEMGPSNPFFGHALERSWPVIFNCTDPGVADRCGDDVYDKAACQCRDW